MLARTIGRHQDRKASRRLGDQPVLRSWRAHEGRAPALLDNLLGAVVLAPFFVFLEVIFHFGYRPELQKELERGGEVVTKHRMEKAKRRGGRLSEPAFPVCCDLRVSCSGFLGS